jgi:3-deoxy-D-manno-octulosonic-acid transferase
MRLLYNISIGLYLTAVRLAAWFNPKAKQWLQGRKNLFSDLKSFYSDTKPVVWFHCASLGEFEQGRPVIEAFRAQHPEFRILLTFFSPSGYEVRKNYEHADYVCYLPADTPSKTKRFVELVNPALVVFVKYEYWHNIMHEINRREVPFYVMSAIFRPSQYFFKWYGKRFLKNLAQVKHYFVQDQSSADLLINHGITQVSVTGDTRFDRVAKIASEIITLPMIEGFVDGHKEVIVAGSTWHPDEVLLAKLFDDNPGKYKLIIAPHEINESHLGSIEKLFQGVAARYSVVKQNEISAKQVIIIDSIGLLSKLYRYGRYAYIGGGFGVGIHNVSEAAVYGIPVIFGPNYKKFREAHDLVEIGGAFSINNPDQLAGVFSNLQNDEIAWQRSADAAKNYISRQLGATEKVLANIKID